LSEVCSVGASLGVESGAWLRRYAAFGVDGVQDAACDAPQLARLGGGERIARILMIVWYPMPCG
jgi:hypothetical protein